MSALNFPDDPASVDNVYVGDNGITYDYVNGKWRGRTAQGGGTADLGKFIFDSDGDSAFIHTTNDAGGTDGYDIVLSPGGESYTSIRVPNTTNTLAGDPVRISNLYENGSVVIETNTGTWTFGTDGKLTLPAGGAFTSPDYNFSFNGNEGDGVPTLGTVVTSEGGNDIGEIFMGSGYGEFRSIYNSDQIGSTSSGLVYAGVEGFNYAQYGDVNFSGIVSQTPHIDSMYTVGVNTLSQITIGFTQNGQKQQSTDWSVAVGSLTTDYTVNGLFADTTQTVISGSQEIKLTTNRGTILFGNQPEQCVPLTLSSHFHIMKQDPGLVDLFFGDDFNYVKLPTTDGVEIGTFDGVNPPQQWQFGTDGILTIPGNIRKTTDLSIAVGSSVVNFAVEAVDSTTIPPSGVWRLFFNDSDYPTLGTTVQIGDTVTTSWGTPITATIVDIQQDSGSWQIHVDQDITAGFNNYDTVTFSSVSSKTWTFGADGVLTAPGHLIPNTDLAYDLGSTSSQWRSIYVGTGTIYIGGVALGVNQDNYVTVDGNPIITVNTTGNFTVQGDTNIVLGAVVISDTAPAATTPGSQWFNTVEGRTYVATGGVWLDASPTQIPSPETYLDGLAIDGTVISTANVDGDAIVIDGGDNTRLTVSNNSVTIQVPGSLTRPYWAAEFGGITTAVTTSSLTIGTGAFYDSQGNVYVLGAVQFDSNEFFGLDSLLLKYDTNGNLLWSRTWHDDDGANCGAVNQAFAIDSNDKIYWLATAVEEGFGCWSGYMDTEGNLGLGGVAQGSLGFLDGNFAGADIACDNSGNYYLAGVFFDYVNNTQTPVVIKVDGDNGAPIWTGSIVPEDFEDLPADGQYRAVTVNPATGDVWAIGDYTDNSNLYAMLSKWDINGTHQWTKKLVTQTGDLASAVIYNGGYVYTIVNDDGDQKAVVSKFDTDGVLIWASFLAVGALDPIPTEIGSYGTGAYDLSFDASGNVYVTGTIPYETELPQLWITKLDPVNGEMLYSRMLATTEGSLIIDQGGLGSSLVGHRVGDIYQDTIVVTAVTQSDINDSTGTNAFRVIVAQLPIDGSVTGTFDNIDIVDLTGDIDSISSTGTYTVTTLVWSTGTSTAIYSTSSISVSYVTDIVGLTGETIVLGSDTASGSTTTNTWTFVNNNIILPPGGDILDSNGNSVLAAVASSPVLANETTGEMSDGSEATVSFTAVPYSVIVVASGSETADDGNPASITGITGMGLTWIQRSEYTDPTSNCGQRSEIWYAVNNSGSSVSGTITITFDVDVDDQTTSVSSWTGCDLSSPWTSSGPSYSNSLTGDRNATVTMTVAESVTTGIVFFAIPNSGPNSSGGEGSGDPDPGYAVGWSAVNSTDNGGAELWEYTSVSYKQFTGPQLNLVATSSGQSRTPEDEANAQGMTAIADALVGGLSSTTALGDRLTAGSNSVVLSSTGTLTLPYGGVISEVGGAFSGAIRLEPWGASSSTQALVIYPTVAVDANHIHLTAGGGGTDLYLGDDDQYVKVDHSGDIVVGTLGANTSTWTFGTDGVLTLPNGLTIDASDSIPTVKIGGTSTWISIDEGGAPPGFYVRTNAEGADYGWQFAPDGVLYLSTASTILGVGDDPNVYIETVSTSTAINTWTFAADGSLTFPDATVQRTAYPTGQQTVHINTASTTTSIDLTELTGSIVMLYPEAGYTASGETHYVNLPFDTNSIALGTRITVLNYHPGNAVVSGWDGPGYTMSQFETIDLVYTFDPGYPGNIWWVTNSFSW